MIFPTSTAMVVMLAAVAVCAYSWARAGKPLLMTAPSTHRSDR